MGERVLFDIDESKSHPDHLPMDTLGAVRDIVGRGNAETHLLIPGVLYIGTLALPAGVPDVGNALRGPASGEPPVGETDAYYGVRGQNRPNLSRLTGLPSTRTRSVVVIVVGLKPTDDGAHRGILATAYGTLDGFVAPQEPGDPFANPATLADRVGFWREHALSDDAGIPIVVASGASLGTFADPTASQAAAKPTE